MKLLAMLSIGGLAAIGLLGLSGGAPSEVEFRTGLKGRTKNQRINALRAASALQGVTIAPGATLSFNKYVGSWSRDRGFVRAPVSYNGHLILAYGGAVCQTSTTLYNAALMAGLEVVERNRHRFAPTYVAPGRDAAVAFPEIDLRIRNPYSFPVVIRTREQADELCVSIFANGKLVRTELVGQIYQVAPRRTVTVSSGAEVKPHRGKPGFDVAIARLWPNGDREHVSRDAYAAMDQVTQMP